VKKSKPYETDEFDELVETLRMFHKDSVAALDETRYVHLGSLAETCIKHLLSMKERLLELESNHVNTRH
jgi:hypothetical protein